MTTNQPTNSTFLEEMEQLCRFYLDLENGEKYLDHIVSKIPPIFNPRRRQGPNFQDIIVLKDIIWTNGKLQLTTKSIKIPVFFGPQAYWSKDNEVPLNVSWTARELAYYKLAFKDLEGEFKEYMYLDENQEVFRDTVFVVKEHPVFHVYLLLYRFTHDVVIE